MKIVEYILSTIVFLIMAAVIVAFGVPVVIFILACILLLIIKEIIFG